MMESNDLEKLFQDAFENFEVAPPVSAKPEIDNKLGMKRKGWIVFLTVSILLLLLSVVTFLILNVLAHSNSAKHLFSSASQQVGLQSDQAIPVSSDFKEENARHKDEVNEEELEKSSLKEEKSFIKKRGKQELDERRSSSKKQKQERIEIQPGSLKTYRLKDDQVVIDSRKPKKGLQDALKMAKRKEFLASSKKKKVGSNKSGISILPIVTPSADGQVFNKKEEKQEIKAQEKTTAADENPKVEVSPGNDKELKKDSSATAVTTDSLVKPAEDPAKVKPLNDASKAKNWMVELYGGPRFGAKTSKTEFALKEATSYQIGLGFSRRLELGPLKYVTLDGEYGSGRESYKQNVTSTSIYFVGIDSIPYFDTITGDTIPLGYTYYNVYDTLTNTTENNTNAAITRFAFGLKAQFNFNLGAGFGLAVTPGYYYSISKYKFSNDTSGSRSISSSQILLGLGVYYDWNRFRFRIGLDTRYELMSKNNNLFIDRRKSMLFTPQFGIAIKF